MNFIIRDGRIALSEEEGDELSSAILISLFCDARADDDEYAEVREHEPSRRGWWGDLTDGIRTGSKLWLLRRAPADEETLEKARFFVLDALSWLKEDGICREINVHPFWKGDALHLDILIDQRPFLLRYPQ